MRPEKGGKEVRVAFPRWRRTRQRVGVTRLRKATLPPFFSSSPNCGVPDPARSKSAGVHWLRGEPRQCGDRAHRLIPPSMAPTGERRPSMACLRPIPAPPRLSPPVCPWLRRCRLREAEGNARRSKERHAAKDVAARGFRPSGTWMYRARVLEQDAEPRGGRNPLAAAAPARSRCFRFRSRSGSAKADPCPHQLGEEPISPAATTPGRRAPGSAGRHRDRPVPARPDRPSGPRPRRTPPRPAPAPTPPPAGSDHCSAPRQARRH